MDRVIEPPDLSPRYSNAAAKLFAEMVATKKRCRCSTARLNPGCRHCAKYWDELHPKLVRELEACGRAAMPWEFPCVALPSAERADDDSAVVRFLDLMHEAMARGYLKPPPQGVAAVMGHAGRAHFYG